MRVAIIAGGEGQDRGKNPSEIGQSFHKTGSPLIVWTLDSFNKNTEPVHARLIRLDDPTTRIIVSVDAQRREFR